MKEHQILLSVLLIFERMNLLNIMTLSSFGNILQSLSRIERAKRDRIFVNCEMASS